VSLKTRIRRLETRAGCGDAPCPDHGVTFLRIAGRPEPLESEIPPCSKCGRPGVILYEIIQIVKRNAAGELVERDIDGE
jgi:hypothetical protein